MWYTLALFVHILGAIGLFVAVSLIVVAFVRMRQASTLEQAREWASVANVAGKSMLFISLVILAPALYMVIIAWGFTTPWVMAALITFVVNEFEHSTQLPACLYHALGMICNGCATPFCTQNIQTKDVRPM